MIASSKNLPAAMQAHRREDWEEAERLYGRLLAENPRDANALHLMGVSAFQQGAFEKAADFLRRALQVNDREALLYSNLGAALRELGRMEEALNCFRRAVELDPQFSGGHYNLALALESQGRLDEAADFYRQAIQADQQFADAYLNLGRLLSAQGVYEEAAQCLRRGLQAQPACAKLHYNLGNALYALGRRQQAVDAFQEAIRLDCGVAEFHNNLGIVLKELGRIDEAGKCFETALRLSPQGIDARFNLAAIREEQGRPDDTLQELRGVIELQPENAEAHSALAHALFRQERFDEAADHYRDALRLAPERAVWHFQLAYCLLSQGKPDDAEASYRRGLELDPDHTAAWIALGTIYSIQQRFAEAEDCYRSALVIDPEEALACYNLANVYKDQWRLEEALDHYDRAVELKPDLAEAWINRGVVLSHLGRLEEAVESHTGALKQRPGDAEALFHRALARLMRGDFEAGWSDYESRWDYEAKRRHFAQPLWDGSALMDHALLIYAEQGIGDEIMFASCLPDVIAQTAACVVECDARLVGLFARSFPLAVVVPRPVDGQTEEALPECDRQIALGSLPRFLRRREEDFPHRRRYLAADPQLVRRWQTRLQSLGDSLKVGISWRGGHQRAIRELRSTTLEQWKPLFAVDNVQFINLQYGECRAEREALEEQLHVTVHDWDDVNPLKDVESFAAQIAALDLVISVDNSTVHMAGALGVPAWTLLPSACNWRWMRDREDSLWYPTMRLFRQSTPGDWEPVFERAAGQLQAFARQKPLACRLASSTLTGNAQHDADVERRKYEHIWTHEAYRIVSPGLLDADKVGLVEKLRAYGCRSVLDAGCGSGKLMRKLMSEFGGEFRVHGFDISANCLDPYFDEIQEEVLSVGCLWNAEDMPGEYDAVLCTDVLEHIPTGHVPAVLRNLRRCTKKLAYLAIALFPDGFGPKLLGEPLHLTVKPPSWWFTRLQEAGFRIAQQCVETHVSGQEMWLHVFLEV